MCTGLWTTNLRPWRSGGTLLQRPVQDEIQRAGHDDAGDPGIPDRPQPLGIGGKDAAVETVDDVLGAEIDNALDASLGDEVLHRVGADAVAMEGDDVDAMALQHLTDDAGGGRGDASRGDADGRALFAQGSAGGLGHADHRADAFGQDPAGDDVEAEDIGHRMNDRDVAGADQRTEGLSAIGDSRDHDLGKAEGERLHGRGRHHGALPAADPQDAVRLAGGDEVAG